MNFMTGIKYLTLSNFNRENFWFSEVQSFFIRRLFSLALLFSKFLTLNWASVQFGPKERNMCFCRREPACVTSSHIWQKKEGKQESRWSSCWDCFWGPQAHPSFVPAQSQFTLAASWLLAIQMNFSPPLFAFEVSYCRTRSNGPFRTICRKQSEYSTFSFRNLLERRLQWAYVWQQQGHIFGHLKFHQKWRAPVFCKGYRFSYDLAQICQHLFLCWKFNQVGTISFEYFPELSWFINSACAECLP